VLAGDIYQQSYQAFTGSRFAVSTLLPLGPALRTVKLNSRLAARNKGQFSQTLVSDRAYESVEEQLEE